MKRKYKPSPIHIFNKNDRRVISTKIIKTVLLALFILLSSSSLTSAKASEIEFTSDEKAFIQQHPVIKLGVDPQFVPYEFFDSDGQYKGIAADYIKLLSQRTGIKMEIARDLTWPEAYEKAVERKLDALPCIAKTPEREPYFIFSEPYYTFQRVIIVKESDKSISQLEDLFNKQVAVKENSSHHSYLKTYTSMEFSPYPTEEAALKAVADGRETYFVGNYANSSYQIKANGLTGLKYIRIDSEEKQHLHFAARKDWPQLIGIVNKGLASITEEEKIEINNRWIGIENEVDYEKIIKIALIVGGFILIIILVSWYWIVKLRKEVRERKRAEEDLKIAKEEAEIANQFKSVFLARMSHEIRTPLNAITGMAYLIKKTDISSTQGIYLDKINQAARNMLGIINDILDFSKIEAGKIEIERVSFNLDKVLQQVINIVSFQVEERGINFLINKDPYIPTYFWGDPTRLEQIFLNVVNNAIKFTEQGEVAFTIRLVTRENDIFHIEFSVKDTGIGMSAEQLDKLFKPFDQGDSSINRRFGGTGLGLSIVKSIVDMLGGEIRVYSSPGQGSTFTVQLALEVDHTKETQEKEQSASIYLKNIRVLVLEKSLTYTSLLKEYFNSFNMRADFTESEDKAMQLLRNIEPQNHNHYDLLIVDNDTPGYGGIKFIEKIKADASISIQPKIILMMPLMREYLFEEIAANNIDLGITKPIIASILYNGIIEIFRDKVLVLHDSYSHVDQTINLVAEHPYHVLVVEDNQTNQFIAQSILEQAGFQVSLADDGKLGFDFFQNHQQDLDLILMDLHMPVLNGYEAARLIRQSNPAIPIVAMTADAIAGVEEKCKNVGINHFISKPFEPEQLVANILDILTSQPEKTKASKCEEPVVKVLADAPETVLNENEGMRLLGNNRDLYLMVLNEYYQENQNVLDSLSSSITDKRYSDAVQIIHKIKSSTGSIGAKQLSMVASELQKSLVNEAEAEIDRWYEQFQLVFTELFNEIAKKINQV